MPSSPSFRRSSRSAGSLKRLSGRRPAWADITGFFSVVYNPEKTLKLARAIAEADNRGPEYNFYGAPVIINISCERDDRNALLNGAAAIENLMLAATELGLGSCWINQVRDQCDVPAVRALLTEYGTPEDHIVTCSAAIGYIAKETQPHERREGVCNIVK